MGTPQTKARGDEGVGWQVEGDKCPETGWGACRVRGDRGGRPHSVHQTALAPSPARGPSSTRTSRFSGGGNGWLPRPERLRIWRRDEQMPHLPSVQPGAGELSEPGAAWKITASKVHRLHSREGGSGDLSAPGSIRKPNCIITKGIMVQIHCHMPLSSHPSWILL